MGSSSDFLISLINIHIILCLPYMVLTLILIRRITRDKIATGKALNVVRWIILAYTLYALVSFIGHSVQLGSDFFELWRQGLAINPLRIFLPILSCVLPFILFHRKWAKRVWVVLIISFIMKMGLHFQRYALTISGMPSVFTFQYNNQSFLISFLPYFRFILQGAVFGIVLYNIFRVSKKLKNPSLDAGF